MLGSITSTMHFDSVFQGEQAGVGEGSTKMCTCTGPLKDSAPPTYGAH